MFESLFRNTPPVVKNIIIVNIIFLIATFIFKNQFNLYDLFALHHWSSDNFMVHQYVTHFFMHSANDITHILFNMFAVWMFGRVLEQVWGSKRFLIYYVFTAIGASLIYTLYITYDLSVINNAINVLRSNPTPELFTEFVQKYIPINSLNDEYRNQVFETLDQWSKYPNNNMLSEKAIALTESFLDYKKDVPMVGASGAVFGILLAFGMLFPNTELMLLFPPIPIKAKWFVLFYGLFELYSGFNINPYDNVAHFAHLGGMLFGFILIKYWNADRNKFY